MVMVFFGVILSDRFCIIGKLVLVWYVNEMLLNMIFLCGVFGNGIGLVGVLILGLMFRSFDKCFVVFVVWDSFF